MWRVDAQYFGVEVSQSLTGTQIVTAHENTRNWPTKADYDPSHDLWPKLIEISEKRFRGMPHIEGMELVSVNVRPLETQFSFKKV